ncbi:hypothetical protein [Nitrosomonas halophila]|uniref:Uncharacterized protein n=1 Tax=Nitrosomonas halophila TaxID=44576 RepID=A0A1H3P5M8_9PROT|nr:hypothetical protein [Nitrosomonas halophila]SDY96263.1 hypothetical protein SAMN05421881_10883 [Nitrosomonas halophila]
MSHDNETNGTGNRSFNVEMKEAVRVDVAMQRTSAPATDDQALWVAIRHHAKAVGFNRYQDFINCILCRPEAPEANQLDPCSTYRDPSSEKIKNDPDLPFIKARRQGLEMHPSIHGVDAYNLLKVATEAFLIFECGLVDHDETCIKYAMKRKKSVDKEIEAEQRRLGEQDITVGEIEEKLLAYLSNNGQAPTLPYLRRIVRQIVGLNTSRMEEKLPYCEAILQARLTCPSLLELIWSYWHEEGMLVQTLNAITLRFQNRLSHSRDPLINLELDPLRPLNNLLWGFVQDEFNRLSVRRRAYEYDHHYGFTLIGKAIGDFRPADSRSKFIEAFHNLLYRAAMFYREDDDTTIHADAFALLNALREVHLILAEGAHNQFGDLPWTARREMLIMQWLLARPEMKEFLRGRHMVPYQEPWMGAVDDMRRLQGWGDTSITHFHELARYGEQILLSIRYGDWIDINDQEHARNWARYWRPEIQRYIHAYMATTGVDLSIEITDTRQASERFLQPSLHLQKKLAAQRSQSSLQADVVASEAVSSEVRGYAKLPYRSGRRLIRYESE